MDPRPLNCLRPRFRNAVAIFHLVWLCGCASPTVLRFDHDEYSKVYGDACNKQLLLNLARLSMDEPVYFIQLGSISSQYQFAGSLGASPTYVFRHTPASLGGTFNAGLTQTPIFQFVPLTGTNIVQAILSPISEKVFMTFYDQGYPADLVIRTMVASIEHKKIVNGVQKSEFWINDPNDTTYHDFLKFCADVRSMQLSHVLVLDQADQKSTIVYSGPKAKLADIITAVQATGFDVSMSPTGEAVVRYKQPGFKWKVNVLAGFQPRKVKYEQENGTIGTNTIYQLTEPEVFMTNYSDKTFSPPNERASAFSHDHRSTLERSANAINLAADIVQTNIVLKMRTFEAALYCVARQQTYFTRHIGTTWGGVDYRFDEYGPYGKLNDADVKVRPAMTLEHAAIKEHPDHVLAQLRHGSRSYAVADFEHTTQNSLVFTMLSYLYAQTSISTQNLPVQQTIRLQ